MAFIKFMSNPVGRVARVLAGIALVIIGLAVISGIGGIVVAAIGVVMFLAGAVNFCLFAPLFRAPFMARDLPSGR